MKDFLLRKKKWTKKVFFILLMLVILAALLLIINIKIKQTESKIEFKLPEHSYPIQNEKIGANSVISFKGDGGLLILDHESDPQQDTLGTPTLGSIGKFVDYILIGGLTNENLEQAYIEILYTDELLNAYGITDPSLLKMYFWDETSKQWIRCSETMVDTEEKSVWATVYRFPMLLPSYIKEKYKWTDDYYFMLFAPLAIEEMPNYVAMENNTPWITFTPDPQMGNQRDGTDAIYIEIYQDSGMQNKFLEAKWEGSGMGGEWGFGGGGWVFIPENKFPTGYYYYRIREKVNGELKEWTHLVEFRIQSIPIISNPSSRPEQAPVGTQILLTAKVESSTGNQISSVTIDLAEIGGTVQQMYDDGTNGDIIAGDSVYSLQATIGNVSEGEKLLDVVAQDNQGNIGEGTILVRVGPLLSDLTIKDISYSNGKVNAIIENIGDTQAENVLIRFYNGDPDNDGIIIGKQILASIQKDEEKSISLDWNPSDGYYDIYVEVDPENMIQELFELNNMFYNTVLVDNTSPEAKIYFDPIVKELKVIGADNFDNKVEVSYTETYQQGKNLREYTLKDDSGNILELTIEYKQEGNQVKIRIVRMVYNEEIKTVQGNLLSVEWSEKNGKINNLNQKLDIESINVHALYDSKENKTKIWIGNEKKEYDGMKILILITSNGGLNYEIM